MIHASPAGGGFQMIGVRRAFLTASAGRYVIMAINLVATVIMARLLTPQEFGVSVLGGTILSTAEAVRALAGGAYIIQQRVLTAADTRTSFTVNLVITLLLAATLAGIAGPMAQALDAPNLAAYLRVILWGFLAGPVSYLVAALLSRQMHFGAIALVSVLAALINAIMCVGLSLLGFGCMSFAWASTVSAAAGMSLFLAVWRDWSVFRPTLQRWRNVIAFGVFDSMTGILAQLGQALPFVIVARLLNAEAVGICQRSFMMCLVPERVVLAGVGAIALPAFSKEMREQGDLKAAYLRAMELLTAALWPALILLSCLAEPIIRLLLGEQWRQAAPLTQLFAAALVFSAPLSLTYPVLVALGAIRFVPPVVGLQVFVSAAILVFAAARGLHAVALSTFVIIPFNSLVSLLVVQRLVGFGWIELAAATRRSLYISALSSIGPVMALVTYQHRSSIPLGVTMLAIILSAIGWTSGVWLTGHPLLPEFRRVALRVRRLAG